jgi:soluble lytic murein transglycosylase-like protein
MSRHSKKAYLSVHLLVLLFGLISASVAMADAGRFTREGLQYLHGEGVSADPARALVYLCAAAGQDHAPAAFELGWLYLQGRGVPRNEPVALAWFQRAADLGEQPPARLMQNLASVTAAAPACIDARGQDLEMSDRRRAALAVAIYEIAPEYGLDPALVFEVVRAESNFNPRARSHKGALGLMQLIPATARRFGVKDPFEPRQNLHGGMAYLRWLLQRFDGDLRLSLAGYNAGERAVERYGDVPPYAETREYVRRILSRYGDSRA